MTSVLGIEPVWTALDEDAKRYKGFIESWTVNVVDPKDGRSLWIRLNLLSSTNGFRKVCEAWVIASHRKATKEVSKIAMKQGFDLSQFKSNGTQVQVGSCELGPGFCKGSVLSKGRQIQWNLNWKTRQNAAFNFVPAPLGKLGLVSQQWGSPESDLEVQGSSSLDGEEVQWKTAHGSLSHRCGFQEWNSWVRCHSNSFTTEKGEPVDTVFEGFSGRIALPVGLPGPRIHSACLIYQGKRYEFNSIWESLRMRSQSTANRWNFEVERDDLRFRGEAIAENRDFAGITYEDTDGSLLYGSHSKLANLTLWIYRRGKLEQTLVSNGTASLEIVDRSRNPYVQFGF
ncbi:MAG: hypothetical protein JNL01_14920 [Bdellovibrionales bacterium]|nr:hypothetical protein [Bdellovibrionales bacterium]